MEALMRQLLNMLSTGASTGEQIQIQNMLQELHGNPEIPPQERPEIGAIREALLAGPPGQHPAVFLGPVAEANPPVVPAAVAVVGAVRILAAEVFQVVHGMSNGSEARRKVDTRLQSA